MGRGKLNATSILLEGLTAPESEALIENLGGGRILDEEARARVAEAAEGNPLFLEQMVAMVREGGELAVPPTIQALLATRLDRLGARERALLERAAVVGREFSREAVLDLAPADSPVDTEAGLEELQRRQLIRPAGDGFRFGHALIRDAAYDSVPKERRADLHERLARWLAGREQEDDEILGYHLEQAYRYRAELGRVGERDLQLARQAAERLGAAGGRSYGRGDMPAAVGLLRRAVDLLPPGVPLRLELLTDLGEALRETGRFREAEAVLAQAGEGAAARGDRVLEAYALVIGLRLRAQVDPTLTPDELLAGAERARAIFEEVGDERRLAKAWFVLAWAPWLQERVDAAEEALRRAIDCARGAGDERTEAQSLNLFVGSGLFGPIPVPDAIRRCEDILARPPTQQRITASVYRALAGLKAMEGRFDEAREFGGRAGAILEDLGLVVPAMVAAEVYGLVELLAGDPVAAERALRRGYETLLAMGEKSTLPNLASMLAQALDAQGRLEEALAFTEAAEEVTAPDDLVGQVQWRGARAKVLARLGSTEEAESLAREAAALAGQTPSFLLLHGDALMDLAEVLLLAGSAADAAEQAEEALRCYVQKGSLVSAARARTFLQGSRG